MERGQRWSYRRAAECREGSGRHQQVEKVEFLGVDEVVKVGVGRKERKLSIHEKHMHEKKEKEENQAEKTKSNLMRVYAREERISVTR